jgi:hypothetical protein
MKLHQESNTQRAAVDHERLVRLCSDLRKEHEEHPTVYDADRRIKALLLTCAETIESSVQSVQWIKARDVNSPGRWYWARIAGIDEQEDVCPQVVFITIDDDGMSAPEWRVLFIGEDERTAKTLSYLDDRGWEFMEIPLPNS